MERHRSQIARQARRGWNAARRVLSGLRLHAECVSPEVPNDLFVAHLSIYELFVPFARGRKALDLGCGTGYGTDRLLRGGAWACVGVDRDPRSIAYARRRFLRPKAAIRFLEGDAQDLPAELGDFGAIVSSNVFEHLADPDAALDTVRRRMSRDGSFLLVVPPIVDEASLSANRANRFHISNLYVGEWAALLRRHFEGLRAFRHLPPPGSEPDFTNPFPSRLRAEDFEFKEVAVDDLGRAPTLGAVFLCAGPISASYPSQSQK
jgi:SAM-dependent methyltransferase